MWTNKLLVVLQTVILTWCSAATVPSELPPYIHQCSRRDPNLQACYIEAIMHIRPWLAKGIPEVSVPSTEPFRLAELSLSLTEGPRGYRISLKDIDVLGISKYIVRDFRLGAQGDFSLDVAIPGLSLEADYASSGVLIMIRASGRGRLHGVLETLRAQLRGSASLRGGSGGPQFVRVDALRVDLKVGGVSMRIERAPGENFILAQATNMLLRTSSHLVLDAMMPELRLKLADVFLGIANSIFDRVPVDRLLRD